MGKENDSSNENEDGEEEDEEEIIRKYQQMSGHRRSFEVWLTAKETQQAKEQADAENEARRLAEHKALEEMQRRMKAKTFDEWLREKDAVNVQSKSDDGTTEAEKEARRAQASFKYIEWMRKKDAEALEREEKIRAEEKRKYEELKKKREEAQESRWTKIKVGKIKSLPT